MHRKPGLSKMDLKRYNKKVNILQRIIKLYSVVLLLIVFLVPNHKRGLMFLMSLAMHSITG